MSKRLLVTGGAGFVGANFVHHWCRKYWGEDGGLKEDGRRVVVLDTLSYAGNKANIAGLFGDKRFRFVEGDICNRTLVSTLLATENIDTVVHCAAESHVDRSILGPAAFVQTNVVGTFALLEAFRDRWQTLGQPAHYRFLQVSTDEVYGSLAPGDPPFTEATPYAPNSPYSASKAGSDHLVRAYFHTYGLPTLITACSNNYGPYQYPEKLIPLMCLNILLGKPLPVYGDGQNVRDWLHVRDHCEAIDAVLHRAQPGEVYNIGGNSQVKNLDIVYRLCNLMEELAGALPQAPRGLITFVRDRPGHDRRYAMDISKIQQDLDWSPAYTFEAGLRQTVAWYLAHRDWWGPLLSGEYKGYYERLYSDR